MISLQFNDIIKNQRHLSNGAPVSPWRGRRVHCQWFRRDGPTKSPVWRLLWARPHNTCDALTMRRSISSCRMGRIFKETLQAQYFCAIDLDDQVVTQACQALAFDQRLVLRIDQPVNLGGLCLKSQYLAGRGRVVDRAQQHVFGQKPRRFFRRRTRLKQLKARHSNPL